MFRLFVYASIPVDTHGCVWVYVYMGVYICVYVLCVLYTYRVTSPVVRVVVSLRFQTHIFVSTVGQISVSPP